jgi:hypothetical protein
MSGKYLEELSLSLFKKNETIELFIISCQDVCLLLGMTLTLSYTNIDVYTYLLRSLSCKKLGEVPQVAAMSATSTIKYF